jgi:hypothetical protein
MTTQRELVEQMFEAALAVRPDEREAFLDKVCGDDLEQRRGVEYLLAEDARAGSFLQHPCLDHQHKEAIYARLIAGEISSTGSDGMDLQQVPAGRLLPGQILIDRFVVCDPSLPLLPQEPVAASLPVPHLAEPTSKRQQKPSALWPTGHAQGEQLLLFA